VTYLRHVSASVRRSVISVCLRVDADARTGQVRRTPIPTELRIYAGWCNAGIVARGRDLGKQGRRLFSGFFSPLTRIYSSASTSR